MVSKIMTVIMTLILITTAIVVVIPTVEGLTYVVNDGFESGTLGDWSSSYSSASTTVAKTGSYSLRISCSAGQYPNCNRAVTQTNDYSVSYSFYIGSIPSSGKIILIQAIGTSSYDCFGLAIACYGPSDAYLQYYNGVGWVSVSGAPTLHTGSWHNVNWTCYGTSDGGAGSISLNMDGTNYNGLSEAGGHHRAITKLIAGSQASATSEGYSVYFDDIKVSYGPAQATWKPNITSTPSTWGLENQQYQYTVTTNESSTLQLYLKPSGATLNGTNISWTPSTHGVYQFRINATSTAGTLMKYQYWNVTVNDTWYPSFTNTPSYTGTENLVYTYTPSCNESVTYNLVSKPEGFYWNENQVYGVKNSSGVGSFHLIATSTNGHLSTDLFWNVTFSKQWGPTFTSHPCPDEETDVFLLAVEYFQMNSWEYSNTTYYGMVYDKYAYTPVCNETVTYNITIADYDDVSGNIITNSSQLWETNGQWYNWLHYNSVNNTIYSDSIMRPQFRVEHRISIKATSVAGGLSTYQNYTFKSVGWSPAVGIENQTYAQWFLYPNIVNYWKINITAGTGIVDMNLSAYESTTFSSYYITSTLGVGTGAYIFINNTAKDYNGQYYGSKKENHTMSLDVSTLDPGNYYVVYLANSTHGRLAYGYTIELIVYPVTWAPTFTSIPDEYVYVNDTFTYEIVLNETSTIEIITIPDWMLYENGTISGHTDVSGTYNVVIRATSVNGTLSTTQDFNITVDEKAPVIVTPVHAWPVWAVWIALIAIFVVAVVIIVKIIK